MQKELDKLKVSFVTNLAERHAVLLRALQSQNFREMEFIGHNLKGSGSSYGFDEISQLGKEIEIASKTQNLEKLEELIHRLDEFLKQRDVAIAD
ncbi:MAG: Hpt domain-containing protein [bacterium]